MKIPLFPKAFKTITHRTKTATPIATSIPIPLLLVNQYCNFSAFDRTRSPSNDVVTLGGDGDAARLLLLDDCLDILLKLKQATTEFFLCSTF